MSTLLNPRHGQFCDATGATMLGSDSVIIMDGRHGALRRDKTAKRARDRFRKNFPAKFAEMTHYIFRGEVRPVPST